MTAKTAPPSKDVVYIDVDDEITSIIDKVDNAKNKVVALVLPKRAASLQSIVNMKLLKRSADTASKSVVLITSERALLPLAGAAGLHVAKNLQSAPEIPEPPIGAVAAKASAGAENEAGEPDELPINEDELPAKFDYNRPIGALAERYESENPETIDLDDEDDAKPAKAAATIKAKSGLKIPDFDKFRLLLGLGAAAFVGLIIFLILAVFVLPKAVITLTTASEPVSATFKLTASDKETFDPDNGTLPAKLEATDQTGSQQVTATGQQNNGNVATGGITMTAQACAPNLGNTPDPVSSGTGVSAGGNNYTTTESASFHFTSASGSCINYSSGSVSIKATAAGSKYNVSNSSFSVRNRSDVSASGSASGGSDDIVTVLSQGDVDTAKQKLTNGTTGEQFVKDFEKKLSDQGEYVLTSTLKPGEANVTATPAVGQPASNATVNIKITYTVLTVKKDQLKEIIRSKLADQVNKSKQKLNDNFMDDASITVQSQSKPSDATLQVNVNTTAVPIIDTASVKKIAEGKKAGDIKAALNAWPGVKNVDVKLSPFWVSKAPKKDSKVKVILKEDKSNQANSVP